MPEREPAALPESVVDGLNELIRFSNAGLGPVQVYGARDKLIAAIQAHCASLVSAARTEALEEAAKECEQLGTFYEQQPHDYYRGAKWCADTAADRIRQLYRGIPDA